MKYHKNAATCYKVRLKIHTSTRSISETAELNEVHPTTVRRWKGRTDFADRSHRPKTIKYALTDEEKEAFITERALTFEGLDEIIDKLQQRFEKKFVRTTVWRLLKSVGLNRKPRLKKEKPQAFPYHAPGALHIDVTEVPVIGEKKNDFLYVAIDRATRFIYMQRYNRQNQINSLDFMQECIRKFPFAITSIMTDNGKEFSNSWIRPTGSAKIKKVIGSLLTRFCNENGIKHKFTKPYRPQTNGMVERANRTIKENTIYRYQYQDNDELNRHLDTFLTYYNTEKRHGKLFQETGVRTPIEAVKKFAA